MKIVHLRTNHQSEPLGIDNIPEFSWRIESVEQNILQSAYKIIVKQNDEIVWDSGKINNRKQSFIQYKGKHLLSCTKYVWEVFVWNNNGEKASAQSIFETAFLSSGEWKAKWVESTIPRNQNQLFTYGIENPAILFNRNLLIKQEIYKARLYATSYGCYKLEINGKNPDDREFAPEFTPYDKILNYQCYDVGTLFSIGENKLSMLVGDGWYFCEQTAVITDKERKIPSILYQLEVLYKNGIKEIFCSDGSETCEKSNILFSDLFMGEKQDLTLPKSAPQKVEVRDYGYSILRAQPMQPVRAVELFPAQKIIISPKGETIIDFGQVICGRARVKIDLPKGHEVTFEYTEVLDKDGNYFSTMTAKQMDIFVSNGDPTLYEAQFTYHGFRFIRVTGMKNINAEDFTAVLLSTEKENASTFLCSDERFNRLFKNVRYSQKNNMMSIPTDCPTREKAGWTGDILIYAKTAMLNEDMTPFLSSWLEGLIADQTEDGVIPIISPYTKLYDTVVKKTISDFGDSKITGIAGWSDAIVWVPYHMYQITGNELILSRCYDSMKKWCDYIIRTADEKRGSDLPIEIDRFLWNTGFHFGEWLVPGRTSEGFEICKETACYIAPFFGYQTIKYMSEIASILNHKEADYYKDIAEKMKNAIQKGLFETDSLPDYLMGGYVIAFAFNLVPDKYFDEYKKRLVALVEENDRCLGTGFLATPFLLDFLEKIRRKDLAKDIIWQTKPPSWLFEVEHGATAIWENWISYDEDGNPLKTSFDHYAFGCVDDWICRRVGGIATNVPGFSHIVINPQTDLGFDWCKRTFICEAGEISVYWTKNEIEIRIPCNTTATIFWKSKKIQIGSGNFKF